MTSQNIMEPSRKMTTYLVKKQTVTDTKNEINPCILLDHQGLKLEFNNTTNYRKPNSPWKLNNNKLNHRQVNEERKVKDFLEFNENEYKHTQTHGSL